MATTLDHISNGRAILGIGAAWFAEEHEGFGLRFGEGPPERLRWLAEALPVMRGMLDGTEPSATGPRYAAHATRNLPGADPAPPADPRRRRWRAGHPQARRPLRRREQRRRRDRHRPAQGRRSCASTARRSAATIARSSGRRASGRSFIRDDRAEAERLFREAFERNASPRPWDDQPVGTPEDVAERLAPYLELGYRHFIAGLPATYDEESMTRLISDVKPLLERGS